MNPRRIIGANIACMALNIISIPVFLIIDWWPEPYLPWLFAADLLVWPCVFSAVPESWLVD